MEKRTSITRLAMAAAIAALASSATAYAGVAVPYSSDLGVNYSLASDWTQQYDRNSKPWEYDRASDFSPAGTAGGMMHTFEPENQADAALVSPAITLNAGTTYTVGIWVKTLNNASNEKEAFKLLMSQGNTLANLKAGTILIEKSDYLNNDGFELLQQTFTAEATSDVHFGVYCCSEYFQGTLCATGFSITEGEGGSGSGPGTVDPPAPEEPRSLPYTADFSSPEAYEADWTSLAGPEAEVTDKWRYNSYGKYPEFDAANGKKEDNYLISPPLKLEAAGAYLISLEYTAAGSFDIVLGTDNTDAASFSQTLKSVDDVNEFNVVTDVPFTIEKGKEGVYYIAMHARSDIGSYMGYRLHAFKIKQDLPVPAPVTDLTAAPDAADGLAATLRWTNPALTTAGTPVDALTKIIISRNGEEIKTLEEGLEPGKQMEWTDNPSEAGAYTYSLIAHNSLGASDAEPMVANCGYVGKPEAAMPYSISTNSASDKELALFTAFDANKDGRTWTPVTEYYSTYLQNRAPDSDGYLGKPDDYIATPYLKLTKGYYRLDFTISARSNNYEVGYATTRHNLADNFVKVMDVVDEQESGLNDRRVIVAIPADGDYCFVWHHTASNATAYPTVNLSKVAVTPQVLLPETATSLNAKATPSSTEGHYDVTLTWTNPDNDNAGLPLESLARVEIKRDGQLLRTIDENIKPGTEQSYSYTTENADETGEHKFTVIVYNDNGCAEAEPITRTLFIGAGRGLPYTADFTEWDILDNKNTWYSWEGSTDRLSFNQMSGVADDYALSPYLWLEEGNTYQIDITTVTEASGNTAEINVVAGPSPDADLLAAIAGITTQPGETLESTVFINTPSGEEASVHALQSADANNPVAVAAGNIRLGVHINEPSAVSVTGFSVTRLNYSSTGDISATPAARLARYDNDTVTFADTVATVAIADISGRIIARQNTPAPVNVGELGPGILIITAADNAGNRTVLRISNR